MVFSSLLFVFAFFTPHLVVYFFAPNEKKNLVLLVSSLIFYAWGGPKYLLLLMLETFISWYFALKMNDSKKSKLYLILACCCLLGLLAIFKYTGFFLNNLKFFIHWPDKIPTIVLPIGISFYTFQLLSYVVDVYKKEVSPQQDYWKLLLYSSLFHQCIAGPIVRYETVQNEIDNRKVSFEDVFYGFRRFSIGLAKKAILANSCASIADTLLPGGLDAIHNQSVLGIWLSMICYMLQIYLDFSAYSDMAIGMGRMIGFHYLENFNYPYIAKSVQDFWRRWHISLSSFFRDYVYIPLGGNRCSKKKWIRNMFVVWFLTGMWHGASWNFILWGLYYLCFLLLEKFYIKDRMPDKWKRVYTLLVVFFGCIIFKYSDLSQLGAVLLGLFGIGVSGFYSMEVKTIFLSNVFFLIFSMLACTTLGKSLHKYLAKISNTNNVVMVLYSIFDAIVPFTLMFVSFLALLGNSYNPFLYFQF